MKTIEPRIHAKTINRRFRCRGHMASTLAMRAVAVLVFALVANTLLPGQVLAASPLDGGCQPLLGFGESYVSSNGASRTHCGIDCTASSGETLYAPAAGTVCFVGSVPAGEESGSGTTTAMSIDIGGGLTVTMMPVQSAWASVGEAVDEGDAVGSLAASGDKSMSRTHLHVGLKRVESGKQATYLDPSWLLGIEGSAESGSQSAYAASEVAGTVAVDAGGGAGTGLEGAASEVAGLEGSAEAEGASASGEELLEGQAQSSLISSGDLSESARVELAGGRSADAGEAGLGGWLAGLLDGIGDFASTAFSNVGNMFASAGGELAGALAWVFDAVPAPVAVGVAAGFAAALVAAASRPAARRAKRLRAGSAAAGRGRLRPAGLAARVATRRTAGPHRPAWKGGLRAEGGAVVGQNGAT